MGQTEILIAAVLVAVAVLGALASRLSVPYPIVLVVGGAVVGFIPGLPAVTLDPAVGLVLFLPPLLYNSSIFANFHDFRADLRAIALSAVLLVLVTICAVAVVAHTLIPGLGWEAAFVLGTIVSPTDPVAAATIMRRLDAPRRLVSIIEGEGLFNDATALVAYRAAVVAVVAGTFSLFDVGLGFVVEAAGGVAIGMGVGVVAAWIRKRVTDPQVSVSISLLTGYAAYVPADAVGVSAVLSTVAAGLYMGIRGPKMVAARPRLQEYFVWDVVDFLANAILFVLIGLQLHAIVNRLAGYSARSVAGYAVAVIAVVVGVRLVWHFTVPYVVRVIDRRPAQRVRRTGARWRLVTAWCGMRGAVSIAVALALPLTGQAGSRLPQRDLIIFLTFVVIFFTLVVQALSLPALIRRLGMSDGGAGADEETRARLVATKAALDQIDGLAGEEWTHEDTVQRMRARYEYRKQQLAARVGKIDDEGYEDRSRGYQQLVQLVLAAQRQVLLQMRSDGKVSNEVMNRVQHDLDLEESRLET